MPQVTGPVTVLGVEGKGGMGKNGKPYTIYKVQASDGNYYDTFDAPTAQKAQQALNQTVTLSFEPRQNGQFTNYDLKDVLGATQALNGHQEAPAASVGVPHTPATIPTAGASTASQDKDTKITRMAAHKAAAILVGQVFGGSGEIPVGAFRSMVDELVRHSESGAWQSGQSGVAAAPVPVPLPHPAPSADVPWE